MCKIVFSIAFNVSFWCSKEPSHREDSFEHQNFLSENIMVDLRTISKLTSKLNIKKRARIGPPAKCHLNGILWADLCGSDIVCGLGLLVMTCIRNREREREREIDYLCSLIPVLLDLKFLPPYTMKR